MFQFARFAFYTYLFSIKCRKRRVSPFGNPRIKVYSQLPRAYRSVSRPSSPLDAKASTKCTFIAWIIICTEINLFLDKNSLCDGLLNYIKQHWILLSGLVEVNGIEPMTPCLQSRCSPIWANAPISKKLVGRGGLEPPTSRLSGVRSNHLSYRPQNQYCQKNKLDLMFKSIARLKFIWRDKRGIWSILPTK